MTSTPVQQTAIDSNALDERRAAGTSTSQAQRLEQLAFEHGQPYDAYLATESDRELFWADDHSGVIAYVRRGRYLIATNGPLAPRPQQPELIRQFLAFADRQRRVPLFFNVTEEQLQMYYDAGLSMTKIGEEAVVPLKDLTWKGKPYAWLRRQENYCQRHGVVAREVTHEVAQPGGQTVRAEIEAVSDDYIQRSPYGKPLKVFIGQLNLDNLKRRRVFVAEGESGVEAFAVCDPVRNGRRWVIEMYRSRGDATRGVVPFLMMQIMRKMRDEGVESVSLCLVPALRVDSHMPDDCSQLRRSLVFWRDYLNWIYDIRGIHHFKSRFRPAFESRYVAARPPMPIGAVVALGRCWGIMTPNPLRVIRRLLSRLGSEYRKQRATLTDASNKSKKSKKKRRD